jgi:hypothetical protein
MLLQGFDAALGREACHIILHPCAVALKGPAPHCQARIGGLDQPAQAGLAFLSCGLQPADWQQAAGKTFRHTQSRGAEDRAPSTLDIRCR